MNPKAIKTKSEYFAVLARIEELMDAKLDTAEGDELDNLSGLVHEYEELVFPINKA
jgi:HTH-type transcriptional regulator/antitoxin HigA